MSRAETELRLAQVAAERARRLLLSPSTANLELGRPLLERACDGLREVERCIREPGAGKRELLAGLGVLQLTARRAAALLEQAARFEAGWFQALTAVAAGSYTRDGESAPPVPTRSLSVEG
jgi:hypothetical protein